MGRFIPEGLEDSLQAPLSKLLPGGPIDWDRFAGYHSEVRPEKAKHTVGVRDGLPPVKQVRDLH